MNRLEDKDIKQLIGLGIGAGLFIGSAFIPSTSISLGMVFGGFVLILISEIVYGK